MISLFINRTLTDGLGRNDRAMRAFTTSMLVFLETLMVLAVFAIAAMIGGIVGTQEVAVAAGQVAGVAYVVTTTAAWAREVLQRRHA